MSMSTAQVWTTILAGGALVATACSAPSAIPDPLEDGPRPQSTGTGTHTVVYDPIGQNGSNGLEPIIYLANRVALDGFMAQPLTPSGDVLAPSVQQFMAGGVPDDRRQLIQYAADCALPFGSYDALEASDGTPLFQGTEAPAAGFLSHSADWPTTALNAWQQMAVNTCLITRMNKTGAHVSIWLNGLDVNQASSASDGDFGYVEAHWLALPSPINIPAFGGMDVVEGAMRLVWPSPTWEAACPADGHSLTTDAKTRVCGNQADADECRVAVAPPDWCTPAAGNASIWTCTIPPSVSTAFPQNLHAIETRLQRTGWVALHTKLCAQIM
jgi:hypothetical protein